MKHHIELPQSSDTPVSSVAGDGWQCHYGYARCAEARATDEPGQDYVALRVYDSGLLFVVCDGVSQSYYGDFAARFAGNRVLDWLSSLQYAELEPDIPRLQHELNGYLLDATHTATEQLDGYALHADVNGLLREVLLDKKRQVSSAMYVGGRLDFPGERHPAGRLVLVWQGDMRVRLWMGDRERGLLREVPEATFGGSFHTRERWNSVSGPVGGMPNVYSSGVIREDGEGNGTLLVYSDGLAALDSLLQPPDGQLVRYMSEQAADPDSDDMSVVQINWHLDKCRT